jgi:small subunit ribosomal protein S17
MTDTVGNVPAQQRGIRKVWQGRVVSDKMEKTVVVAVENRVRHPLYGRTMTRTTRFKAHDETSDAHVGDTVEIVECRPISKDKRFRIQRIVQRAK